ncbi:MAG: hypothetical protein MPW15_06920 [Candidatus Manganitrophus sp.]|nr:hypothetical protein [Candidatus Manganitrophus sp.]
MIKSLIHIGFVVISTIHIAEAADFKIIPQPKLGMVSATANHHFSGGAEKTEKTTLPEFASLPQVLQAASSDQAGADRSAKAEARMEMESGVIRFKGKLETADKVPTDFLAPVASVKGSVTLDLKVMLPNPAGTIKGTVRVTHNAPDSMIAAGTEKGFPENIIAKVFVNDEIVLNSTDFVVGVDKEIPIPLHHEDIVTILLQEEFSMIASGQVDLLSTLQYNFTP